MWLVFLILFFVIGIVFSSFEVNLVNVNISDKNSNFKIILYLKLFYLLKTIKIVFDKSGMEIFSKKIYYKDILTKKQINKINKETVDFIKDLKIKINKANFILKIGLIDISLTNIAIVFISTILPIISRKQIKNVNYKILPLYNNFKIDFNGKITISIKIINILKFYFKNIKPEITHNKVKNREMKESF